MDCKFVAGQRVVCIRDDFNQSWRGHGLILPRRNHVYTVREIVIRKFNSWWTALPAVLLKEIVNPALPNCQGGTNEIAFWHRRFEPYVPRGTDISELEKLARGRPLAIVQ
jgi:hypothetical protein